MFWANETDPFVGTAVSSCPYSNKNHKSQIISAVCYATSIVVQSSTHFCDVNLSAVSESERRRKHEKSTFTIASATDDELHRKR